MVMILNLGSPYADKEMAQQVEAGASRGNRTKMVMGTADSAAQRTGNASGGG